MRKVIKIFLTALSSLVLLAIVLPVVVWLLLFLPPVQEMIVRKASYRAAELLGTKVTFDKVRIKLFNAATLEGLYVEDYDRDTLLYVSSLSAGVDPVALFRREVRLTGVRLSEGAIRLKRYADGQTNAGLLFARFRSEEPFRVTIHAASIGMEDMAFRYDNESAPPVEGVMDFGNLRFSDIDMRVSNLSVTRDTISARLDGLSLTEKSGFRLTAMSSRKVLIAGGGVRVGETVLTTPDSELYIDHAYLDKAGEAGFADFMRDISVDAEVRGSTLALRTVGYFIAAARDNSETVRDLNIALTGSPSDISGWMTASAFDATDVSMLFAARGLPDLNDTDFSIALDSLTTNPDDLKRLLGDHPAADTLSRQIGMLGTVTLKGNFTGRIHNFTARAGLRTAHGSAVANLVIKPSASENGNTEFNGELNSDRLELGELFGLAGVGRLSFSSDVDGSFGNGRIAAKLGAHLTGFEYNGYNYHDIELDGSFDRKQFVGRIASRDPNLDFDFNGLIDLNDSVPAYDFAMKLRSADLAALGFNRRDSVSQVCFDMRAAGRGDGFENLNGRIRIDDMLYVNHMDSIRTGGIVITGRNDAAGSYLSFSSGFADASFSSTMDYARLAEELKRALSSYLPSLSGYGQTPAAFDRPPANASLNIEIKEANNVAGIFFPGLIIAKGTGVAAEFDPDEGRFSVAANSDYIEFGGSFISDIEVAGRNHADSLSLSVSAGEVYAGGFLLPSFSLTGGARENRIEGSARFSDPERERSAFLGASVVFTRDSMHGTQKASVYFAPSFYRQGTHQWNLTADNIVASDHRLEIGGFRIDGDGQSLRVSGTVSDNERDFLRIDADNFDLNPISSVLNTGYQFYGRASGFAMLRSPIRNPVLNARIDMDSLWVDHVKTPPMVFLSEWDAEESRINMMLIEKGANYPVVSAKFLPETKQIDGTVMAGNVDLSLLDVLYEGTLSRTSGKADVNARLTGFGRKIKLNGTIDIKEYRSKVDFLNVAYSTEGTPQMTIRDNVLEGNAIPITDPEGNRGTVDASIDLNKLNNVKLAFRIHVDDMLLLNTTNADNELFYGRVYGSGTADIRGNKMGVEMNITAATAGNSRFYMPLEDKSDMDDADFVRFVQPRQRRQPVDSTGYNVRKRMIMERERANRRIESSGNINTNIVLSVRPNTLVELLIDPQTGHTVRGRGNGSVNMHINPLTNDFTMYGDYQITEGIYLFTLENIIEKPFAIEPGSYIQWTGDPIDALLNISGVYRLKSSIGAALSNTGFEDWRMRIPIECRIMLGDRLSLPTLAFNITAPGATPEVQNILAGFLNTQEMTATQFFFLLATGGFYDYEGSTGNIGEAAGSATAFEFLSNQFNNWISSDRFNIGIRYRPKTETTSDEWGIDLSQQLLGDRLLLEIEGNYDTRNNEQAVYSENMKNFTGDFYLTGLLDRAGNLKAKLFSRTISRFDENQGLQEWGAGVYFTEDFDTFGDVLRNIRERLSGKRQRKKALIRQIAAGQKEVAAKEISDQAAEEFSDQAAEDEKITNL